DGISLYQIPRDFRGHRVGGGIKFRFRALISRLLFMRADLLVVEARHVKDALTTRWRIPSRNIVVVPNTFNAAIHSGEQQALSFDRPECDVIAAFVTRAYAH